MKIQSQGADSLVLSGKNVQVAFNPVSSPNGNTDFVALSQPGASTDVVAKKVFNTPGEFEVSGVLAEGFFTDNRTNVVHKVVVDDIALVHFGNLKEAPDAEFYERLGENVDIVVLVLGPEFDDKKAKALIDKIDPRMAVVVGDNQFFPKMVDNTGAKTAEENPMSVSKSSLSDDKTDVIILSA